MTLKQIIVAVVVALLVSVGVYAVAPSIKSALSSGSLGGSAGTIHNSVESFIKGVGIGNEIRVAQSGVIGPTKNQGYWKNNTGKAVIVDLAQVGFTSGIASSSITIFASTTPSATSISSDFASPAGGNFLLINGANIATSTVGNAIGGSSWVISTSTSAGAGVAIIPNGGAIIFQIQERYGCKTVGVCETATSTNRGVSGYSWYFTGHYTP